MDGVHLPTWVPTLLVLGSRWHGLPLTLGMQNLPCAVPSTHVSTVLGDAPADGVDG